MSAEKLYVEGATGSWEVVIGLEVHAQVDSKSKLFSGAATEFDADPNTQVSFIDAGFPGMLPVLNKYCVEQAVKTGLGINAKINLRSVFDRKNYFYADLPMGYQISQFTDPIVGEGHLDITLSDGAHKRIGVERLHLECDAGKSIHDQHATSSYIDLNRAGIALMEIVSKPEMHSGEEAIAYLKKLRSILRYLGTSDGNMEQGSLRADVNVSVRRPGEELGTRAEIKNVNSFRFVGQAIDFEVQRQIDVIEQGGKVIQETRLYDAAKGVTRSMRGKEDAHDYRYFPDPDLLPVEIDQAYVDLLASQLPELPDAKEKRFQSEYGLTAYDAEVLATAMRKADFYEKAVFETKVWSENSGDKIEAARLVNNWLSGEFFAALNKDGLDIEDSKVSEKQLAQLVDLILDGTISGKIAKDVFAFMWEESKDPAQIVQEKGLVQVSDTAAIEVIIDGVMQENQDKVEQYRSGKDKLFGFFVGQVMKAMQGKGNPKVVNELLKKKLA